MKNLMDFIDLVTDFLCGGVDRDEESGLFNWTAQEIREDNYKKSAH